MKRLATVFGVGYFSSAPGTAASLVGLALSWLLRADPRFQAAGAAAAAVLGLLSAGPAAKALGTKDPSEVVIDEVAGMMLALVALPVNWKFYLAGFFLFRFFDILKPFGLRRLERLPGSWGIMFDDLAAGAAANLLLQIGTRYLF